MQDDNTIKKPTQSTCDSIATPEGFHDGMQVLQNSADVLKKYFQILEKVVKKQQGTNEIEKVFDPSKVMQAIMKLVTSVFSDPHKAIFLQKFRRTFVTLLGSPLF